MKLIRWMSSSLRAKLVAMFIILTCIPLIAVGLISYQKSYKTVFGNSKSSAKLTAEQLSRDLDVLMTDTGKLLELEKLPQVLHFLFTQNDTYEDAKDILTTMESYRETYQYDSVLNITMINLYGRGISERRGVFQLDRNPLRNPHLSHLLKHPDTILNVPPASEDPLDRLDGFEYHDRHVISIMATIKQRITHEVIGFIVIDLDDAVVKSFCNTVGLGKTGFFYVADDSGTPIFTPDRVKGASDVLGREELAGLMERPDRSMVDSGRGKPRFVFATLSKSTGWRIVGQVPLEEIVSEATAIRRLIIISVTLSIVFAITLHFFVSFRLTRPIQLLKNKMRLAASGFLEAKVVPEGRDEIADLGSSFNIMLSQIRQLLEKSIREQEEMKKSELRALQAQINPHFLYNTLDSILWMAEAGRNAQVIQLVQSLSRLFRISLSAGRDWIPLGTELEHVRSYLEIQQMRYRDILDYDIQVDELLHGIPVLKMMLQPIVENALYHGIKNKRGKGRITVSGAASASGQELLLIVEDNGIGMPPAVREQLEERLSKQLPPEETGREVSGGFGLHNVQQRIRLFYGEAYGVLVESVEGAGTTVTIRIPIRWRGTA